MCHKGRVKQLTLQSRRNKTTIVLCFYLGWYVV